MRLYNSYTRLANSSAIDMVVGCCTCLNMLLPSYLRLPRCNKAFINFSANISDLETTPKSLSSAAQLLEPFQFPFYP
jgi:hypothetical protein